MSEPLLLFSGHLCNTLMLLDAVETARLLPLSLWTVYDNPLEKKRVFNKRSIDPAIDALWDYLASEEYINTISKATGITDLRADPSMYGGGINISVAGGKLDLHKDADLHPNSGLERKLTVVAFASTRWKPSWGGDLELWSGDDKPLEKVHSVPPRFGTVAAFRPETYHGYPHPLNPPDPRAERISITAFYYGNPTVCVARRPKAQFAALPGDTDHEMDKLRSRRSTMNL